MAIRLGSNAFTSEKLTSTDLNDTFKAVDNINILGLTCLQNLNLTAYNNLSYKPIKNFIGDIYIDANGYLDKIDTTNTTATFDALNKRYVGLKVGYSNATEITTNSTTFIVIKTFNVTNYIYKVEGEFKNYSAGSAYVKVQFTDATGTWESSELSNNTEQYVLYSLLNPYPDRKPTKVEILLRISNINYTAYEKNTNLYIAADVTKIVQTNSLSIQSGFTHFIIIDNGDIGISGSITYDISFDGGTNYQIGLNSLTLYEKTNSGTNLILKQKFNAGSDGLIVKLYDFGVLLR